MKKIKVAVHSGDFHADDAFSVATIMLLLGEDVSVEILRTRELEMLKDQDYVLDVGRVLDPEHRRFDHHQVGGAGKIANGIPYATFGLVWKEYGEKITGSAFVAREIEKKLVEPLDATDNGVAVVEPVFEGVFPYAIEDLIFSFRPTWKEKEKNTDEAFFEAVMLAKKILTREIVRARAKLEADEKIRVIYDKTEDKRILVLDNKYPWSSTVNTFPETLFVIFPHYSDNTWYAYTVEQEPHTFLARKYFPESWAGKAGDELAEVSGVSDAVFCHNKRFMVVAKSKEGAVRLAELALES